MTDKELLEIFKKTGGLITNSHIVLTSGRHSHSYFNKDAIYPHTKQISIIAREMAMRLKDKKIEAVVGPALGGIILSQWTAYHLSELTGSEVLGIYTEKTPEKNQILTRGYDKLIKNKNILVVEDITATGGSVIKVISSVRSAGGNVIGVSVMVNREPGIITSDTISAPFYPLLEFKVESWTQVECPLCKKDIPVNTEVGKGKEYLSKLKSQG